MTGSRPRCRSPEGAGYHLRMGRPNLFGMSEGALAALVAERGEPAFRARQIYAWLYHRRVREVGAMANLPKPLRSALAEAFELRWPEVAERALSFDGTRKYLFRLDDGATIEAVYIPEDARRTICISPSCTRSCTSAVMRRARSPIIARCSGGM